MGRRTATPESWLIIDGHPYRGATSNGLELGHISVDANGSRCDCGNRGCVDAVAGAVAVAVRARRNPDLVSRLGLGNDPLADFKASAVPPSPAMLTRPRSSANRHGRRRSRP